jgi:hypothetical protein
MKRRKYLDELGHWDGKIAACGLPSRLTPTRIGLGKGGRAMSKTAKQAVRDAETFLVKWGEQAHALGWTARELFGLHPVPGRPAPTFRRLSRYDSTGLIWLLHGRPVVALTANEAAIRGHSGATVTTASSTSRPSAPLGDSLDDMEFRS